MSQKMHNTIKRAAEIYEEVEANEHANTSLSNMTEEPDYVVLVKKIVEKLENKRKIDILSYDILTKKYPQTKDTLNQLIAELRVFSIYDDEPHTVNFDYSAYLRQIGDLARIV